jgi:hypothetical protein
MGAFITPNVPSTNTKKVESETIIDKKQDVVEPEPEKTKSTLIITLPRFSKTEMIISTLFVGILLMIGALVGYEIKTIISVVPPNSLTLYHTKLQQKIVSIDKLIIKEQSQEDVDSERIQRLERNRKLVSETLTNSISFSKTNEILIINYIDAQTSYLKTNGIFLNKTK